jgi:hypothetical protein
VKKQGTRERKSRKTRQGGKEQEEGKARTNRKKGKARRLLKQEGKVYLP